MTCYHSSHEFLNFSLHLSDDLVRHLNAMAQATGQSRNAADTPPEAHRCTPRPDLGYPCIVVATRAPGEGSISEGGVYDQGGARPLRRIHP
ncbi:MAG: ribbon-helix-helix domain-containing protein [Gammaproteobacteria bacterium]